MKRNRLMLGILVLIALLSGACGGSDTTTSAAGDGTAGARTVEVRMVDTAFEPSAIAVTRGEEIRFVFRNDGAVKHDAFIGDDAAQANHEMQMRRGDDMAHDEHGGGDTSAMTVDPGATGSLTHQFDQAGETLIGCHQPGHYDAMKMVVTVS